MISSKRKTLILQIIDKDIEDLDSYIATNDGTMAVMSYYQIDGFISALSVSSTITSDVAIAYRRKLHERSKAIFALNWNGADCIEDDIR